MYCCNWDINFLLFKFSAAKSIHPYCPVELSSISRATSPVGKHSDTSKSQNIIKLDISMNNALSMDIEQAVSDLDKELANSPHIELHDMGGQTSVRAFCLM
ncbi:hypothetical protein PoB_006805400 [Plakobranchus ocellatus]|uniref:Uncharacterized protein n=1 Tax=Plakobranchus ocellatus TaxID=259542 RepID=A0AAV4DBL5_9GAST|nr:hypothetical protein PoB_006805400 [Plakobranchus ocellatus]